MRDVAYESVLRTRRQHDHACIARWLADATERSGRADEYAGLIAGHLEQAGEDAAAAAWYLRAGRQAAKVFANTDALALLGKALATATGDHALRFDVLAEREGVLDRLGDRPAQEADLDAMAVELTEVDDPRRKSQLLVARARWSFLHSDYAAQSVFASEGAALARAAGLLDLEANAVLWWGKGLTWAYQHDEARSTLEQALALARRAGLRSDEAETLRYLAIVANNQSRLAEAEQLLYETLELRRRDHDMEGEGSTLGQLGTVLYNQGRFDDAAGALTGRARSSCGRATSTRSRSPSATSAPSPPSRVGSGWPVGWGRTDCGCPPSWRTRRASPPPTACWASSPASRASWRRSGFRWRRPWPSPTRSATTTWLPTPATPSPCSRPARAATPRRSGR